MRGVTETDKLANGIFHV